MRKAIVILFFMLMLVSVSGCSSNETVIPYTPSTETMEPSEFTLPTGYTLELKTDSTADILYDGQIVGGLHLTSLTPDCIHEKTHRSVAMYLDYLAPIPLVPEWIIMQGEDFLSINLAVTDPDKDLRTETSRRIFVSSRVSMP